MSLSRLDLLLLHLNKTKFWIFLSPLSTKDSLQLKNVTHSLRGSRNLNPHIYIQQLQFSLSIAPSLLPRSLH